MAEKQSNHLDVSPAEVDAILLTVRTAELVAKVSNKFKYALGGPAIQAAQRAGSEIGKGFRAYALREKLNRYREANEALGDLRFAVEVLLCAGQVTPEEKAIFDEQFGQTQPQVLSLITSTERRLADRNRSRDDVDSTGQNPDGNAPGATS